MQSTLDAVSRSLSLSPTEAVAAKLRFLPHFPVADLNAAVIACERVSESEKDRERFATRDLHVVLTLRGAAQERKAASRSCAFLSPECMRMMLDLEFLAGAAVRCWNVDRSTDAGGGRESCERGDPCFHLDSLSVRLCILLQPPPLTETSGHFRRLLSCPRDVPGHLPLLLFR